jgi:hypothetical protein
MDINTAGNASTHHIPAKTIAPSRDGNRTISVQVVYRARNEGFYLYPILNVSIHIASVRSLSI